MRFPYFILALAGAAGPVTAASSPDAATRAYLSETYGRLPLAFEANRGQVDPRVRFLSRGPGYTLFLTSTDAVLSLTRPAPAADRAAVIRMKVVSGNEAANVTGVGDLPGKSNYLIGSDPAGWRTGVPSYAAVRYEAVYPGVDLVFHGSNQRQLEYDFVVAPGADPGRIRLGFEGAKALNLDGDGNLVLRAGGGDVIERAPVAYQDIGGQRHPVDVRYERRGRHAFGFRVAAFDRGRPLVIDPVLAYSTYFGGSGGDGLEAIAVDGAGNAYVTGGTSSLNFPTANAVQPSLSAGFGSDAVVAKFSATGALVYSTYVGGAGDSDSGTAIAVDSSGSAYVAGRACSTMFPTVNPLQAGIAGFCDAFVSKLSPSGSALIYSTYLGGNIGDEATGIAVDSSGSAYVTGFTNSTNFPTLNAFQPSRPGGRDGFVSKLSPAGNALVYSTYLGGTSDDFTRAIIVDDAGSAYVTGSTFSTNLPVANALLATKPGPAFAEQAFVTKLAPSGSALAYSTFLGGGPSGGGTGWGIAVDTSGNAYVTGTTNSPNFPVQNPLQAVLHGSNDVFVSKLSAAGNSIVYSTYLGGNSGEHSRGIVVNGAGEAFVAGTTFSTDFPLAAPVQSVRAGNYDVFVARLSSSGNALLFSTYVGGSDDDFISDGGKGIGIDAAGNAYAAGSTFSDNFPTVSARQRNRAGSSDAYVFKIAADPPPQLNPTASAGPDQAVNEGTAVTLDGSASTDPNGDPLHYHWEQIAGPAVILTDATASVAGFTAPSVPSGGATLTFRLTVDDGVHTSPPDTVDVTVTNVNQVPVADAGGDQTVQEGSTVILRGADSFDSDGDLLTYEWTQTEGPAVALSDPTAAAPTFTAPPVGPAGETLAFTVKVGDGVAESTDEVQVVVANVNQVPVAQAGSDQTADEGTAVTLHGTESSDPDREPLSYAWTQVSGPVVALSNSASAAPSFTAPAVGAGGQTLVFQLVVSDGSAASEPDQIAVTVRDINQPPSCALAQASVGILWPPNHKLVPVGIVGVADPEDHDVTLTTTAVTQDEPVNGLGDGDTAPDAVLQGATVMVRAERSGTGTGRVYHLTFTAADASGATCTGTVTVCVPHDRRDVCLDEGQSYDSLHP